jgi:hypothetical protein
MSRILVFAEQRDGELKKVAFENLSLGKKFLPTPSLLKMRRSSLWVRH